MKHNNEIATKNFDSETFATFVQSIFEDAVETAAIPKKEAEHFSFTPNSKNNAIHVKHRKKRIFGISRGIIVVTDKKLLDGISYEEKNYGCRVDITVANIEKLYENFGDTLWDAPAKKTKKTEK